MPQWQEEPEPVRRRIATKRTLGWSSVGLPDISCNVKAEAFRTNGGMEASPIQGRKIPDTFSPTAPPHFETFTVHLTTDPVSLPLFPHESLPHQRLQVFLHRFPIRGQLPRQFPGGYSGVLQDRPQHAAAQLPVGAFEG